MNKRFIVQLITISLLAVVLLAACAGQPGGQAPANNTAAPTFVPTISVVTEPTIASTNGENTAAAPTQAAIPVTSTEGPTGSMPTTAPDTAIPTQAQAVQPVIDCTSPAELTPAMTEGPYFKTGSPERSNLAEGLPGTKLTITGYVLTPDCQPVPNARVDVWQTDAQGNYDNAGYTLRGHVLTDASGRYQIETIVPGGYPGRTEHIHVKAQAPNGPELTTQWFFPDAAQNQSDRIFDPRLLLDIQQQGDGLAATFNFVVSTQ